MVDWRGFNLSSAMGNNPYEQVPDTYFWHFVDRGDASADTPLFTGTYEGNSLARVITREFDLSPHEAEATIELARWEAAL